MIEKIVLLAYMGGSLGLLKCLIKTQAYSDKLCKKIIVNMFVWKIRSGKCRWVSYFIKFLSEYEKMKTKVKM